MKVLTCSNCEMRRQIATYRTIGNKEYKLCRECSKRPRKLVFSSRLYPNDVDLVLRHYTTFQVFIDETVKELKKKEDDVRKRASGWK